MKPIYRNETLLRGYLLTVSGGNEQLNMRSRLLVSHVDIERCLQLRVGRYDAHLLLVELAQARGARHGGSLLVLLVVLQLEQQRLFALTQLTDRLLLDVLIHQVALHLGGGRLVATNCGRDGERWTVSRQRIQCTHGLLVAYYGRIYGCTLLKTMTYVAI